MRAVALFSALILLFVGIGYFVGYFFIGDWLLGMLLFLLLAAALNFVGYFFSAKIVLKAYRAKIVSEAAAPKLHRIVRNISMKTGLPMPKIALIPTQNPNAFATGRNKNNAVVAATQGIVDLLDDDELEGVLAHEMAHIGNRDILVMSAAATIAGAIAFAATTARWGVLFGSGRNNGNALMLLLVAITVPIAAMLVQLAISRGREYEADRDGAMMSGKPMSLARALAKLEEGNKRRPLRGGNPASASMFIVNPFRGSGVVALFMTHPPIKARIRKLEQLAEETGQLR